MRTCQVLCILLLCGLLWPAWPALAQTGTVIRLDPAPAAIGEGQTAAVAVRIEDVSDLYGFDIRLSFDPAVVEVVDADPATPGVQIRPGDLLKLDFVAKNVVDNEQGMIWFALTQVNPSAPVSGSGDAFFVTFRAKQPGAASPLAFTYTKLAAAGGVEIVASPEDSEIRVVKPEEAPATPTPAPSQPQPAVATPVHSATPRPPTATPKPAATVKPTGPVAGNTAAPEATPEPAGPASGNTAVPGTTAKPESTTIQPSPTGGSLAGGVSASPTATLALKAQASTGGGSTILVILAALAVVLVVVYRFWWRRRALA